MTIKDNKESIKYANQILMDKPIAGDASQCTEGLQTQRPQWDAIVIRQSEQQLTADQAPCSATLKQRWPMRCSFTHDAYFTALAHLAYSPALPVTMCRSSVSRVKAKQVSAIPLSSSGDIESMMLDTSILKLQY